MQPDGIASEIVSLILLCGQDLVAGDARLFSERCDAIIQMRRGLAIRRSQKPAQTVFSDLGITWGNSGKRRCSRQRHEFVNQNTALAGGFREGPSDPAAHTPTNGNYGRR